MLHCGILPADSFDRLLLMPVAPRITLLTRLALSPETTFALWTQPDHVSHWWGGLHGRVMSVKIDPRPRGMFWIATLLDDGHGYDNFGSFTEVTRGEVLVADWDHGGGRLSHLVIQLLKLGDETEITLVHRDFPDAATRDFQQVRWADALDALQAYATTLDSDGAPFGRGTDPLIKP